MSEPVVRIGARVITHEAVKLAAARTAGALQALGVGPGDRVAVVMRNDPDFLMISAACGLIGAIPVPANWHWRGDELRHVLTHSGSRAVFGTHDTAIIRTIEQHGDRRGLAPADYEIHMLYGIQRDEQRRLARDRRNVRVLIAYGTYWFPWYMRRLAERPANVWFVARSLFR